MIPSTEFRIRRASTGDAQTVYQIFWPSFQSLDFLPKLHSDDETRCFISDVLLKNCDVWLAERSGQAVAMMAIQDNWIDQLYVGLGERNIGAGFALLAHAKQQIDGRVYLHTFQRNFGARRFYERHGFAATSYSDGKHNAENEPDIRYTFDPTRAIQPNLTKRLIEALEQDPICSTILQRLPQAGLEDAYLVSGGIFQMIWNKMTDRPLHQNIKDYDIFYMDPNLSKTNERAIEKECQRLFADIDIELDVKNQARVHLWYEEKFGIPREKFTRSSDGIDWFLQTSTQIGVRLEKDGLYNIYAPYGLNDIFDMILRPNHANGLPERYAEKCDRWKAAWPETIVLPWEVAN